ncbi:diaminopimelate decarboxylase [Amycolatopsis bartoniae]|uniref:Diaminopimelate decarboxylase n=1 Tax=Amycolatopsis bartoniae TaxID=941986 RepID=A0A8H9IUC1_9PSEU|nr:type III PLP-dependent enzyme [Amycolatopsis bartoniae]MBB2934273.1 diaminopimelate decarboxylase [Amycolatopsis bartoniae]TVT08473.1 type III PLP-dependent enzyme [Amycolatopsis bartoniae]GHF48598.1 diaminopimelate decarboxylase [Amycolatopsis bartoniae]
MIGERLRAELVEKYGTPLYVYELDRIGAARQALFDCLPEKTEVFYAVKANPHPEVIRELAAPGQTGCKAEISSAGELSLVLQAGRDPADILYTGPAKTEHELFLALKAGVRLFSAESPADLAHIGAVARGLGVVADCLLRINDVAVGATGARMTGRASQFGIDSELLGELMPDLRAVPGTVLVGLHFFSQSNAQDEQALLAEFGQAVGTAVRLQQQFGVPLRFLDLGGGFACPYGRTGTPPTYSGLRSALEAILDRHLPRWRGNDVRIAVESGRYLVGASGTLLLGVRSVKISRGRRFVLLDGGVNVFGGLSGIGRLLPVEVEVGAGCGAPVASLAGPLCTPGDILARQAAVPEVVPGGTVAIPNAGAYGPTASLLAFLGRSAPTEVVLRGEEVVSVSRLELRRVREHAGKVG